MSQPVVVLGATSQIARDFIVNAHREHAVVFALFARRPEAVSEFLHAHDLPTEWLVGQLSDFPAMADQIGPSAGVINFVGVGDPAKAMNMGAAIFDATAQSDSMALAFIANRPGTPYVFCSSGAVYGAGFAKPADSDTPCVVPVNALQPQDFYTIAKLHAEAIHRASVGQAIVDLRIFNYFSRSQDIGARFLITDMLRCVAQGRVFETTDAALTRDYIHPSDFSRLMIALLTACPGANMPVDAYSLAPVTKSELLELFRREFGLKIKVTAQTPSLDATGAKQHYYSSNRAAGTFGYRPRYTSTQAVLLEARAMLDSAANR